MENQNNRQSYIQFAADISNLALEQNLDHNATLNGTAIASAAFVLDYCSTENGINEAKIPEAVERFQVLMGNAVKFAVEQIKQTN